MNPGHEALALVRDLVAKASRIQEERRQVTGTRHLQELYGAEGDLLADLVGRARGILIAAGGLDGCGVRQRPANENRNLGWCSSCGSYHELGDR